MRQSACLPVGRQRAERIAEKQNIFLKKKARALKALAFFIGRKSLYFTALILFTTPMISGDCLS